jgi:hypothetical protein
MSGIELIDKIRLDLPDVPIVISCAPLSSKYTRLQPDRVFEHEAFHDLVPPGNRNDAQRAQERELPNQFGNEGDFIAKIRSL